jgi:hypothetical protein
MKALSNSSTKQQTTKNVRRQIILAANNNIDKNIFFLIYESMKSRGSTVSIAKAYGLDICGARGGGGGVESR